MLCFAKRFCYQILTIALLATVQIGQTVQANLPGFGGPQIFPKPPGTDLDGEDGNSGDEEEGSGGTDQEGGSEDNGGAPEANVSCLEVAIDGYATSDFGSGTVERQYNSANSEAVSSLAQAIQNGIAQAKSQLGNKRCIRVLLPNGENVLDAPVQIKSDDFIDLDPPVEKIKVVLQGREGTKLTRGHDMGNVYAFSLEEQTTAGQVETIMALENFHFIGKAFAALVGYGSDADDPTLILSQVLVEDNAACVPTLWASGGLGLVQQENVRVNKLNQLAAECTSPDVTQAANQNSATRLFVIQSEFESSPLNANLTASIHLKSFDAKVSLINSAMGQVVVRDAAVRADNSANACTAFNARNSIVSSVALKNSGAISALDVCPNDNLITLKLTNEHWSNWNENEPNNAQGTESAAHLWADFDFAWNDNQANHDYQFACQNINNPLDWIVTSDTGPWKSGFDFCLEIGDKYEYRYSKPRTSAENEALIAKSEANVWINYHRDDNNEFKVMCDDNGSALPCLTDAKIDAVDWSDWAKNEPNNFNDRENAAHLWESKSGKWNDNQDDQLYTFACRDINNPLNWRVTTAVGPWQEGFSACRALPGGHYRFSKPHSYRQNAVLLAHAGNNNVWLNYYRDETGRFRVMCETELGFSSCVETPDLDPYLQEIHSPAEMDMLGKIRQVHCYANAMDIGPKEKQLAKLVLPEENELTKINIDQQSSYAYQLNFASPIDCLTNLAHPFWSGDLFSYGTVNSVIPAANGHAAEIDLDFSSLAEGIKAKLVELKVNPALGITEESPQRRLLAYRGNLVDALGLEGLKDINGVAQNVYGVDYLEAVDLQNEKFPIALSDDHSGLVGSARICVTIANSEEVCPNGLIRDFDTQNSGDWSLRHIVEQANGGQLPSAEAFSVSLRVKYFDKNGFELHTSSVQTFTVDSRPLSMNLIVPEEPTSHSGNKQTWTYSVTFNKQPKRNLSLGNDNFIATMERGLFTTAIVENTCASSTNRDTACHVKVEVSDGFLLFKDVLQFKYQSNSTILDTVHANSRDIEFADNYFGYQVGSLATRSLSSLVSALSSSSLSFNLSSNQCVYYAKVKRDSTKVVGLSVAAYRLSSNPSYGMSGSNGSNSSEFRAPPGYYINRFKVYQQGNVIRAVKPEYRPLTDTCLGNDIGFLNSSRSSQGKLKTQTRVVPSFSNTVKDRPSDFSILTHPSNTRYYWSWRETLEEKNSTLGSAGDFALSQNFPATNGYPIVTYKRNASRTRYCKRSTILNPGNAPQCILWGLNEFEFGRKEYQSTSYLSYGGKDLFSGNNHYIVGYKAKRVNNRNKGIKVYNSCGGSDTEGDTSGNLGAAIAADMNHHFAHFNFSKTTNHNSTNRPNQAAYAQTGPSGDNWGHYCGSDVTKTLHRGNWGHLVRSLGNDEYLKAIRFKQSDLDSGVRLINGSNDECISTERSDLAGTTNCNYAWKGGVKTIAGSKYYHFAAPRGYYISQIHTRQSNSSNSAHIRHVRVSYAAMPYYLDLSAKVQLSRWLDDTSSTSPSKNIAIKSDHFGKYFVAEWEGNVNANRDAARSLERFTITTHGSDTLGCLRNGTLVAIKGYQGGYLMRDDGDNLIWAQGDNNVLSLNTTFLLQNLSDNNGCLASNDQIYFRALNGRYIQATASGDARVGTEQPSDLERLRITVL